MNHDEVSMYLRNTTILTAGVNKLHRKELTDPIATVTNYSNIEELDGQKLNTLAISSGDPANEKRKPII